MTTLFEKAMELLAMPNKENREIALLSLEGLKGKEASADAFWKEAEALTAASGYEVFIEDLIHEKNIEITFSSKVPDFFGNLGACKSLNINLKEGCPAFTKCPPNVEYLDITSYHESSICLEAPNVQKLIIETPALESDSLVYINAPNCREFCGERAKKYENISLPKDCRYPYLEDDYPAFY